MMKILFMVFSLFIVLNNLNFKLIQLFYQNLFFFFTFYILINYSFMNMGWLLIYNFLGVDIYALGLILLSIWIISLMVMMSLSYLNELNYIYYMNVIIFILIFLFMSFLSLSLIMFYLFFESSLIPVFMLILGWGFQIDRIQAGFYMMLYTLFGSLPLFIMILLLYVIEDSLMFMFIEIKISSFYIYLSLILAFLIKMPMYMIHLWLPKAHVEAPLTGSMILAGVMLKLGSYGLLRFMLLMMKMCMNYNKFIMIISLIGSVYASLLCMCQIDMKILVAYSSVVHMGVLMSGLMTMYSVGYLGSILMMISHGLCSSGLFVLVNINYERLNSRSLMLNKGMINMFPSLSLLWFMLCSSNMSFPPSLNLWSEIMLLNSLIMWDKFLMVLMVLILFFSAFYTLYLFSFSQQGLLSKLSLLIKGIYINEFVNLLLHWIPLNMLFLIMYMYIN